ncbi:hypothetical protein ACFL6E_03500 [Candidatus Neomarinimicrobiota bacterium]
MIEKKLCILITCPDGPSDHHLTVFKDCDYFFVTYEQANEHALAFNSGKSWAFNRNDLYNRVPKIYEYYCFVDYDVVFEGIDPNLVVKSILTFLNTWNPAFYQPYYTDSADGSQRMKLHDRNIAKGLTAGPGGMLTQLFSCFHHSLMDFVFPLPLQFGGFWDAAAFVNILIAPPFEEHVLIDYQMQISNGVSSDYQQNLDPTLGQKKMNEAFLWVQQAFGDDTYKCKNISKFKNHYMKRRRKTQINKSPSDVNYYDEQHLLKYFNLDRLSTMERQ